MFFYFDPLYLLLFVVTLAISMGAQYYVTSTYRKYSKVRNTTGLTGLQVGEQIIRRTRLGDRMDLGMEAQPEGRSRTAVGRNVS